MENLLLKLKKAINPNHVDEVKENPDSDPKATATVSNGKDSPSEEEKQEVDSSDDINKDDKETNAPDPKPSEEEVKEKQVKLYKSPRLKGYITIVLAAGIHFNAVQKSGIQTQPNVSPSTPGQRQYGLAVCIIDMVLCTIAILCHLDRITPLEGLWIRMFRP